MKSAEQLRLQSLILRLHDQGLSETEGQELESLLQQDPEHRKVYYELCDQELQLSDLTEPTALHSAAKESKGLLHFPTVIGMAAALMIGSVITWWVGDWRMEPGASSHNGMEKLAEAVGVVTAVHTGSGQLPFRAGELIRTGDYRIDEGSLTLDFFAGASVQITAPVAFTIKSPVHLDVAHGQLAVEVHDSRSMFKISSERSAYIDLGTEFAINVQDNGSSDLHVFHGSVLASSLSTNGNSKRVHRVESNQTLRVSSPSDPVIPYPSESPSPAGFTKLSRPELPSLQLSERYPSAILNSKPFAYWRFEEGETAESGFTAVNSSQRLRPVGSAVRVAGDAEQRSLQLRPSESFSALLLDELLNFQANQSFTIGLWICPDRINRATVLALYDPDGVARSGRTHHLALIDLMHKPIAFHHVPAAIRTAFRPVPSSDYYSGINMFTNTHYTPGQWFHLVFVKGESYAATYLNGVETERVELGPDDQTAAGSYALVLGQMALQDWNTAEASQKRPFTGGLDEVALFLHALSPAEVQQHFAAADYAH